MPRTPIWPPIPSRHSSGQARVKIDGQVYYLGAFGSTEADHALRKLVASIEAQRAGRTPPPVRTNATVAEICLTYIEEQRRRRKTAAGGQTGEYLLIFRAVRTLIHALGDMPAADVCPRHFRSVRELFVAGYKHPEFGKQKPQLRRTADANSIRVKAVFKWAAQEQLVPSDVYSQLRMVPKLRRYECGAQDSDDVKPVPKPDLAKTIPHLGPQVREMVELQLLCGCRPGEIIRLKPADIDRTKPIWEWKLKEHKNAWRGHKRVIYLGPKAQIVLQPFLHRIPTQLCFSPKVAYEQTRKFLPIGTRHDRSAPSDTYSGTVYCDAVKRACLRAGVPVWSPGQLRHNVASDAVTEHGWDVARQILGHKHLETTRIYVEDDTQAVVAAIEKAG